jgi:hypothetical protein
MYNGKIKIKQIDGLENIINGFSNIDITSSDKSLIIDKTTKSSIINFDSKINVLDDPDNLIEIVNDEDKNGLIVNYSMLKFEPDNNSLKILNNGNGINLEYYTEDDDITKCKISVNIKEDIEGDYNFLKIDENGSLYISQTELENKLTVPTVNISNNLQESDTIKIEEQENTSLVKLNVNISSDLNNLLRNQNGLFVMGDIINTIDDNGDKVDICLENHNEYRYSKSISSLSISFPKIIKDDYIASIVFDSDSEFNEDNLLLAYDIIQYPIGNIVCEGNRRYNIIFYYDGKFMNCLWTSI